MKIYGFQGVKPRIHPSAWVFDDAVIIGDVAIGPEVSVWPGVVIRGDRAPIVVGAGSNIQEHALLHADPGFALHVAENVTVGHGVILHGCTVGRDSVIGIGAMVLNGARISAGSMVTASSLVSSGAIWPSNSLISGNPARVLMALSPSDVEAHRDTAEEYRELAREYRRGLCALRTDGEFTFVANDGS